jgi:hypothetical protein
LWIEEDLDMSFPEPVAGVPAVNTIQMAAKFTVGHVTVWRILQEQLLCPYHLQSVKVKVKVKINATLEQTTKSQRRSTGIDLLFL